MCPILFTFHKTINQTPHVLFPAYGKLWMIFCKSFEKHGANHFETVGNALRNIFLLGINQQFPVNRLIARPKLGKQIPKPIARPTTKDRELFLRALGETA